MASSTFFNSSSALAKNQAEKKTQPTNKLMTYVLTATSSSFPAPVNGSMAKMKNRTLMTPATTPISSMTANGRQVTLNATKKTSFFSTETSKRRQYKRGCIPGTSR